MSDNLSKPVAYAPILTQTQIDRIRAFGQLRQVTASQILYQPMTKLLQCSSSYPAE